MKSKSVGVQKTMKSLMFIVEVPGRHGATTQVMLLAPALRKLGLRTLCVVPAGFSDYAGMMQQIGIEVIECRIDRFRNSGSLMVFFRAAFHFLLTIQALRNLILKYMVDVVYTAELHQFIGPIAAKLAGARVIWRLGYTERHGWRGVVLRWLVSKLADNVIPITQAVGESQFGAQFLADPRFSVIPVCVNTEEFRPDLDTTAVDLELGRRPGEVWICQVGNVYPLKGIEYFVEAAALVRQSCPRTVRFMQIGSRMELYGQYYESIVRKIEALGLKEKFLMLGTRQDVSHLLSASDMLVVPSLSEGLGTVILEAMACAKPVIGTRVGGIPEVIVDGETGLLVPPADSRSLADAILRLIQAPQLAKQMGAAGRWRVQQYYSVEIVAHKLAELVADHSRQS